MSLSLLSMVVIIIVILIIIGIGRRAKLRKTSGNNFQSFKDTQRSVEKDNAYVVQDTPDDEPSGEYDSNGWKVE